MTSQILHVNPKNKKDGLFTSASHFNPIFIKRNKVKRIKVGVSIKEDMRPIRLTELFHEYHFNSDGSLKKQLETYYKLYNEIDTILTEYVYDLKGRVVKEIRKDKKGYFSYNFQYKEGKLIKLTYTKSAAYPTGSNEMIIYSEFFKYDKQEAYFIKYTINDVGKQYKQERFKYNDINALMYYSNQLIVSRLGKEYFYFYNDFGRVFTFSTFKLPEKEKISNVEYGYDNLGNIMSEKIFEKQNLKTSKEFIYNENLLLKAQLSKDEQTGTITIYKLDYEF